MFPPIFEVCAADSGVTDLLGTAPTRFYPFGEADQNTVLPYAVWQSVSGFPENYMNNAPDVDSYTLQVDAYAKTATSARDVAEALRNATEGKAHVVSWRGESRDPKTNHYRYSFDIDWIVNRL